MSKSVAANDTENDNDANEDVFVEDSEVTFRQAHKRFTRPVTAMPALNRPSSASRPETTRLNLPVSSPNFQVNICSESRANPLRPESESWIQSSKL